MAAHEPNTRRLTAAEAQRDWDTVLDTVSRRESRIVIERAGVPVAALVSAQDLARLQSEDDKWENAIAIVEATRAMFRDVPDDELEREVNRAVHQARERYRTG